MIKGNDPSVMLGLFSAEKRAVKYSDKKGED
jgi:hypothetical protein